MVKKISGAEFEQVALQDYAVVDFSANWCGPCKMLAPILEEVSENLEGQVAFYNMDIDENPEFARKFRIMSIPALALLKKGEPVDMHIGFAPREEIENFVRAGVK